MESNKYWIRKANDKDEAYCTVWLKEFSFARQGIKAIYTQR